MATATRMTPEEHKEIFQAMSESVVADPETPTKDKIDPRALRGALHLDEHHPGWADKINLSTFNICDAFDCVVGQVAGYYSRYARDLFPMNTVFGPQAVDFGILPGEGAATELNRSWKILIAERQTKKEVITS